ncbi:MAG: YraN family protein [Lachnospiraceae bacterium]|nr:YraN family protein [Lachnospiraceae bacterium]
MADNTNIKNSNRSKGAQKEELAAKYLTDNNVKILCRNFYFHGGEIDIIAKDGNYLCFIEVKYRSGKGFGMPVEAVGKTKIARMLKGAKNYLLYKKLSFETPCRFDVISILNDEITWYKNVYMG